MASFIIRLISKPTAQKAEWDKGVIMSEYFKNEKGKNYLAGCCLLPTMWFFMTLLAPTKRRKCGPKKSLVKVLY